MEMNPEPTAFVAGSVQAHKNLKWLVCRQLVLSGTNVAA